MVEQINFIHNHISTSFCEVNFAEYNFLGMCSLLACMLNGSVINFGL